jgi:hypothetical protein
MMITFLCLDIFDVQILLCMPFKNISNMKLGSSNKADADDFNRHGLV